MAEVLENATRLSKVIGARPGGTEEEQQASFFIEETMRKAGLSTSIEEFNCNPNYELPRFICCVVSVVLGLLAVFLPLMVVPALLITLITATFYFLEVVGASPLSNTIKRGISQNVVAKYIPNIDSGASGADESDVISGDGETLSLNGRARRGRATRKRKIILVARYDSGRVCRELQSPVFSYLPLLHWVEIAGMALIPAALILKALFESASTVVTLANILLIVGVLASAISIVIYVLHQTAPYSQGANNNASGVAVMLEVAKQIAASGNAAGEGSSIVANLPTAAELQANAMMVDEGEAGNREAAPADMGVTIHGEEALRQAGALPDGVDVAYDVETLSLNGDPSTNASSSDGPAAGNYGNAKAKPTDAGVNAVASTAAVSATIPFASAAAAAQGASSSKSGASVPDWFKRGIAKANERKDSSPHAESSHVARSRFADALEAATRTSANSIQEFEAREAARTNASSSAEVGGSPAEWAQGSAPTIAFGSESASGVASSQKAAPHRHAGVDAVFGDDAASVANRHNQQQGQTVDEGLAQGDPTAAAQVEQGAPEAQLASAMTAAEREAVARQVAEEAAVADRTISYIPVAADMSAEAASEIDLAEMANPEASEKSASDILEEAAAKTAEAESAKGSSGSSAAARKRRELSLPSLTGAIGKALSSHQDAPLAEDAAREPGEARTALKRKAHEQTLKLAEALPSTVDEPTRSSIAVASSKKGATSSFIAQTSEKDAQDALNSLDFSKMGAEADEVKSHAEESIPAPVASATSQFAAIGDSLFDDMSVQDIIVEDADDSDYASNLTHTGAMAGPGYVEMPKSRVSRIKGIFSRKKKEDGRRFDDVRSFTEAVGIDEDFDARKVGSERGGWESFQNNSADFDAERSKKAASAQTQRFVDDRRVSNSRRLRNVKESSADAWGNSDEWDDWNGGAFSLSRMGKAAQSAATRVGTRLSDEDVRNSDSRDARQGSASRRSVAEQGSGAKLSRRSSLKAGPFDSVIGKLSSLKDADAEKSESSVTASEKAISPEDMLSERESIRRFNDAGIERVLAEAGSAEPGFASNGDGVEPAPESGAFPTEVWFVALGAELTDNAGMKSFIAEHDVNLSGAVVIELEALGAGTLSQVDSEGSIRRKSASSRMKRYVAKAGMALGLHINSVKMNWRESSSYLAAEKGLQTIHLAGCVDGKPAYLGEEADVAENLSEETMLENAALVMEIVRTI